MKRSLLIVAVLLLSVVPAVAESLPALEGLVEPKETVEFSSQIAGILAEVTVERGSRVRRGQVVARLKSGVEEAAVKVAEARVEFGERKAQRNSELYKKQLISIHEKDELETEIQLARLELEEAREQLALRTITSTVDGIVVERMGAPGEYVGEEPFLVVAQINPLNIELVVPIAYYGQIKEGAKAQVTLEQPVGGTYTATVGIVDHVLDAASGTFGVRLEMANPNMKLPAGLKCQVVF
jgi:RND family efflux transporter MFP subunit